MAEHNEQDGSFPGNSDGMVGLHDENGKFATGHKKLGGKKKGHVSIASKIKTHLREHPEKINELVEYYLTEPSMRGLLWRMIDGNPKSAVGFGGADEDEELTAIKYTVIRSRDELAELVKAKEELDKATELVLGNKK